VRGEFLDLSGARVYYYAAGTRGAGVPVVFIHGFPTSSHLWSNVVPLMPTGHRVVVLDLLGYGRSDRPLSRLVDARGHAQRIVELLDQLTIERACIVGHGFGGGIAQTLALDHSHRVSHLCLIDSTAFERWPALSTSVGKALSPLAGILPTSTVVSTLRADLARGYGSAERANHSIDLYLRPFDSAEGREAIANHLRGIAASANLRLGDRLGSITTPTCVVWGQLDRLIPVAVGRRLQQSIPGATIEVIPGAKHFTPEEAPRPIADAIQSLLKR
jgi:pimeloyl-ACP methyl ester carboxylesterase